ncbi:TniQ family protein [Brevibacillus sp. M2.1A]|uniref:TniQ family protein n=1 Tax=Brevibacillus sp. M2.1A TaxID=2738980 RepID=UPI00156AA8ED|nr:TniQ family protein [Brevibacillus sp. M2.1A]MCC8438564.1 TniQ family protein [Brevibacillus sp. M2.1A]
MMYEYEDEMLNLLQEISPRSILYNLPPIGIGSIHVESLTSYVSRLSTAHCVTTGVFFTKIIFPYLSKESFPRDGFTPQRSCTFNNFHQSSKELVSALTDLTTIDNLSYLTLIDFSCFLSNYEVRFKKYWCPCCFQEARDNNLPIYEQLLWVFNVVEICPKHSCKLICSCPACKTDQYHLSRRRVMGYCYKCGFWLGYSINSSNEDLSTQHLYWQRWVIKNIEDILLLNNHERELINTNWIDYQDNINEFFKLITEKYEITKFLGMCGIPNRLYYHWQKGRFRASLHSLLKLCYMTSTPLKKFLLREFEIDKEIKPIPDFIYNVEQYKTKPKNDLGELRETILRIINDNNSLPPSLSQLAKSLGYKKPETLRKKLPIETEMIVENYRSYLNRERLNKRNEMKMAIIQLNNRGIYPSQKNVEEELGVKSYFWKNTNRQLLIELCNELGVVRKRGPHTQD